MPGLAVPTLLLLVAALVAAPVTAVQYCDHDGVCVRTERDGVVFFPSSVLGKFGQEFYEVKFNLLRLAEHNITTNAIQAVEEDFQNCFALSSEEVETGIVHTDQCRSSTHPDVTYNTIIHILNTTLEIPAGTDTPAVMRAVPGDVRLTHEIQWPNRSPVNRFIMEHQFSFRLPSALLDLYKLGVNTIPSNIDILDVEYEDVHTQDVSTAVLLNSLFNLTWQMPADVQFFTPEYAFNGTRSMLFNSLTALELQELNVWGKGLRQPTLFRFYTEWRNTSKVMLTDRLIHLEEGTMTSGDLVIEHLIVFVVVAAAGALLLGVVAVMACCRVCPVYKWRAKQAAKRPPNRLDAMPLDDFFSGVQEETVPLTVNPMRKPKPPPSPKKHINFKLNWEADATVATPSPLATAFQN